MEISRRKLMAERRAAGLCKCGKTPMDGHVMCSKCTEQKNTRMQRMRVKRTSNGLCESCGVAPIFKARMCSECYNKNIENKRNIRYVRSKHGICTTCGNEPALIGGKLCATCKQRKSDLGKILRQLRKDQGLCYDCGQPNDRLGKIHCTKCALIRATKHDIIRQQVIDHYGGKCACCGEPQIEKLTIDHINNDGKQHRSKLYGGRHGTKEFCRWIIKNNYPDGLQVLCWNCNTGKDINWGICPHYGDHRPPVTPRAMRERSMKDRVKLIYGGRCVICGESNLMFLTIDHVNNDGNEHRKSIGTSSSAIYRFLRDNGYPKDNYQLLCFSCNFAKSINQISSLSGQRGRDVQMGNTSQRPYGQSYDQGGRGWDTSGPTVGGTDGIYGPA